MNLPNEIKVIKRPQKDGSIKTFYRLTLTGEQVFDKIYHNEKDALSMYKNLCSDNKPIEQLTTVKLLNTAEPSISNKNLVPNFVYAPSIESVNGLILERGVNEIVARGIVYYRIQVKRKDLAFDAIFKNPLIAICVSNILKKKDIALINKVKEAISSAKSLKETFPENLIQNNPDILNHFFIDMSSLKYKEVTLSKVTTDKSNIISENLFAVNKSSLESKKVIPFEITRESAVRFVNIFNESVSWQDFFNKVGEKYSAANFYKYKDIFALVGFDSNKKLKGIRKNTNGSATHDMIFVENSVFDRTTVKRRIIRENLVPYVCDGCGNVGVWQGKALSLQIEHKNGIPNDQRLENLVFMCPNCHSQTSTFGGKSIKIKNQITEDRLNKAKSLAIEKGGLCLSQEYDSAQKKMKWKCSDESHPVWEATYSKIINDKSWCPQCSRGKNQFTKLLNN